MAFALGVFAALAVVVAVVVLSSRRSSPPKPPPPAKLPAVVARFANPSAGIFGLLPTGWIASRGPGLVRLASRDGSSVVIVAALASDTPTAVLLGSAVHALRQTYRNPTTKLVPRGGRLSGLPLRGRVLYARNRSGVPLRILVVAARGKRLDYIVEAFNDRSAPLRDLEAAQEIISSIRLTG